MMIVNLLRQECALEAGGGSAAAKITWKHCGTFIRVWEVAVIF